MTKTVVLLNPMGTDVTPYVNHTSGYAQLLNGTVASPGDTVYTLPYTNQPGVSNISAGKALLDTKLKATSGEVLVFGYSEGCQIADWWLADQGATPATGVDPALVSFLMIGNADRKYGGFSYNRSIFNSVGYTAGKPDNTPYRCVDLARQYDPICDFPTAAPIVDALVGLSYVGSDQNVYAGALNAVAAIMGNTAYSQAVSNAAVGLMWIHTGLGVAGTGYMSVTVSDPVNLSLPDGNITWVWSPTYPVPLLGTGGTFPTSDHQLRTVIEQAYTRPVTIPMPDYGNNSGWGVEPFPKPVSPPPVTGWWAELHVSVNITVAPTVSAAHGHIGAAVAIVVAPAVSAGSHILEFASVIQLVTVTVTATAAVVLRPNSAVTATPTVTAGAGLVDTNSVSMTVTPSVSAAAAITTIASVNVAITASPTVTCAAVVTELPSVATTVAPSVSAAAAVIKPASIAVTVTPAVSVAATVTESATASIAVTPTVTAAAAVVKTAATAVSVTPTVSVSASVAITGPTFDAVGSGALNDSTFSSISWAHTAASGADLFVFIENETNAAGYLPTAVTYNGNAMTSIAANADSTGDSGELFLYHLANAGTGSSKNVIVTWGTNPMYANCNSISFNNVAGVGSPGVANDSNTISTPTQSSTLALPGTLILQGFGYHQPPGSVTTSGGTADYSFYDSTSNLALTINHAATTTTFTGSTSSTYWAGIAVALFPPLPVAVTITPTVSVSMGAATVVNSAALTVTPSVSAAAAVIKPATVSETVTPTVTTAGVVTRLGAVAVTASPTVTVAAVTVLPVSVAITATPSISTASADDTSIFITATPSVTTAATVIKPATVTETVTPTVATAGVVTEFATVTVTTTPTITAVGDSIYTAASAISVTPSVSVSATVSATIFTESVAITASPSVTAVGGTVFNVAVALTVTPSVSAAGSVSVADTITVTPTVSAAATVIKPASVAVTATPALSAVGGTVYTGSVTATATPTVSDGNATAVILPVSVAVTATPTVSVDGSVQAGPAFDAVGAGKALSSAATSASWLHNATAGAYVIVGVAVNAGTATVTGVTYGTGNPMTSLGSIGAGNGSSASIHLFGLAGVATGSTTVKATFNTSVFAVANSVSYTSVTAVGTAQTTYGTGTSMSQSTTGATSGNITAQAFVSYQAPTISAYSATERYNHKSSTLVSMDLGDSTTANETFTATNSASKDWAGIAVVIS